MKYRKPGFSKKTKKTFNNFSNPKRIPRKQYMEGKPYMV